MFDYIIDTNVLMSILISGKSSYKPIVMFNRFVSIDFIFNEIDEYRNTILEKSKLDKTQLTDYTDQIMSRVTILPRYVITNSNLQKATELTKDIDFNDVWFVAMSLEYGLPLLSRDVKLYNGLHKKGFKDIILFDQFLKSFMQ